MCVMLESRDNDKAEEKNEAPPQQKPDSKPQSSQPAGSPPQQPPMMPSGPPPYPVSFKRIFITDPNTGKQIMKIQMIPANGENELEDNDFAADSDSEDNEATHEEIMQDFINEYYKDPHSVNIQHPEHHSSTPYWEAHGEQFKYPGPQTYSYGHTVHDYQDYGHQ